MAAKRTAFLLNLIRCGATTWEQEGRVHGAADLPLSSAGRTAVAMDAQRSALHRIGVIHHPPDEAATETAQLWAAATSARTRDDADLADPDLGLLEGIHEAEFSERYPKRYRQWETDPMTLLPPEGEPVAEAIARLSQAVARIVRKSRVREIGIVLHPIGLGFVRCRLANLPTEQIRRLDRDRPHVERYALVPSMFDAVRMEADVGAEAG